MEDETNPGLVELPANGTQTKTETTISTVETGKPKANESHIMSVSIRALIALLVILTVCYMSIMQTDIKEPLYTLAGLIVGFFFGQQTKPKNQQP